MCYTLLSFTYFIVCCCLLLLCVVLLFSDSKWLEGVVVGVDRPWLGSAILRIHFLGWSDKWDESITIDQTQRLAKLHTWSRWTQLAPYEPTRDERQAIEEELASVGTFQTDQLIWMRPRTESKGTSSTRHTSQWVEGTVLRMDGMQLLIRRGKNERWIHLRRWEVRTRRQGEATPPKEEEEEENQQIKTHARSSIGTANPSAYTSHAHAASTTIRQPHRPPTTSSSHAAAATPFVHPSLLNSKPHSIPPSDRALVDRVPSSSSSVSFHRGQSLDVRDGLGKWLPARILDIEDRGIGSKGGRHSPFADWENDATGRWQPRGGRTLLVHFEGFESKWDEWVHAECFLPNIGAEFKQAIRPRLAPLGMLSAPPPASPATPASFASSASSSSSSSSFDTFRLNDQVDVEVSIPIDPTLSFSPPSSIPTFRVSWFPARVLAIDGQQVQVRFDSNLASNTGSFRFPVWFHQALGEVKRRGASVPIRTKTITKQENLLLTHGGRDEFELNVTPTRRNRQPQHSHNIPPSPTVTISTDHHLTPIVRPSPVSSKSSPFGVGRSKPTSPPPAPAQPQPQPGFFGASFLTNLLSPSSSEPFAVGKLCDVRSVEDGLWSEAKVIENDGHRILVKLVDRETTQEVIDADREFLLAPHGHYAGGELSPRFELNDHVETILHSMSGFVLNGTIKRFKQGQMLVWDRHGNDEYWVNPLCDQVKWIRSGVRTDRTSRYPNGVGQPSQLQLQPIQPIPVKPTPLLTTTPIDTPHADESTGGGFFSRFFTPTNGSNGHNTDSQAPTPISTRPNTQPNTRSPSPSLPSPSNSNSTPSSSAALSPSPVAYSTLLRTSSASPLRVPVGIANLGNTCYLTVALQCLAGLQPLIQYFVIDQSHQAVLAQRKAAAKITSSSHDRVDRSHTRLHSLSDPSTKSFGELTTHFAATLSSLYTGLDGTRIFPDVLKKSIVQYGGPSAARFRGAMTHDAHEFLAVLLNAVHEELNRNESESSSYRQRQPDEKKSQDSIDDRPIEPEQAARQHWANFQRTHNDIISYLFYCQTAQYVVCSNCQHHSCSYHVLGQLTLDIPRLKSRPSSAGVTLDECMATQLSAAELDGYYCSRCRAKHTAHSSMYFTTLPPVLLIQLKRFDHMAGIGLGALNGGSDGASIAKDETPCAYPLELDAAQLLRPHPSIRVVDSSPPFVDHHQPTKYRLTGVVLHAAHHYTAFTRVRSDSNERMVGSHRWCFFNDSKTWIESEEEVTAQQKHVYLLTYQRIEP